MMRGPDSWSVACRKPDLSIAVAQHQLPGWSHRSAWLKLPLFRGCVVLTESLSIGMKALMVSANHAMDEDEQLSDKQLTTTLVGATVLFSAIFIVLPVLIAKLIDSASGDLSQNRPVIFSIIEGLVRLGMFLGYLLVIGRFKDVRRVFQYHGAEHKTIYAYENGDPLVPADIDRKYPTLHVRCGTNFLFIVLFLTIIAHFLIDLVAPASLLPRIGIRILAIPVLAGFSYEVIKLASRNEDSLLFKATMWPGLLLQKITTRPPSLDQIEVAIAAMRAVAPAESDATDEVPDTPVA
jgi:uncharacterized protein YqhQ